MLNNAIAVFAPNFVSSPKATGGTVTSDSTYWYHTFTSNGTFTPSQALSCDVVVVAGGAGGGYDRAAGGGVLVVFYTRLVVLLRVESAIQ